MNVSILTCVSTFTICLLQPKDSTEYCIASVIHPWISGGALILLD
jgi:hypothetical protein